MKRFIKRLLCWHDNWDEVSGGRWKVFSYLNKYRCRNCGKEIFREFENRPVNKDID